MRVFILTSPELCSLLRAGVQTPVCVFLVFADNDYAGTRFVFESVDTERIISLAGDFYSDAWLDSTPLF